MNASYVTSVIDVQNVAPPAENFANLDIITKCSLPSPDLFASPISNGANSGHNNRAGIKLNEKLVDFWLDTGADAASM